MPDQASHCLSRPCSPRAAHGTKKCKLFRQANAPRAKHGPARNDRRGGKTPDARVMGRFSFEAQAHLQRRDFQRHPDRYVRGSDSVTPNGNWCVGVTITSRGAGAFDATRATSKPFRSTGTPNSRVETGHRATPTVRAIAGTLSLSFALSRLVRERPLHGSLGLANDRLLWVDSRNSVSARVRAAFDRSIRTRQTHGKSLRHASR